NLWVHGRVEWPDEGDALLGKPVRVRVLVNDFEQFDTPLEDAAGRTRAFRAEVRLNREANRVELQFPEGVKFEEQDRPVFPLLCARPAREQRLHVVVIGPGQSDPAPLIRRMLNALQANRVEGD